VLRIVILAERDRGHAGPTGALTTSDEHANEEVLTNLSQDGWGGEGFLFLAAKD
jgi:hypothetical protein